MTNILAVTWGEEELALRRLPSEGVWGDFPALKCVPLQRPTRGGRFEHPDAGGQLGAALTELFADVDINIPCWLLLPNQWTLRFISDPPDLKSPELILNHLRWESQQRIAGDPEDYRIAAALLMGGQRYFVCLTRSEVIQRCIGAAETAEIELAGVGLEPQPGENYTFEHPLDLRDALPLETEDASRADARKKVSPPLVGLFLLVVVVGVGGYLLYSSGAGSRPPVSKPKPTAANLPAVVPTTPKETVSPLPESVAKPVDDTVASVAKPGVRAPLVPTVAASTPALGAPTADAGSPLRGLFKLLPEEARTQLVVLSPTDLKVEVSGLASPDQWIGTLKKLPHWGGAGIVGKYETPSGGIVAIRLEAPGWSSSGGVASDAWQTPAKAAGLTVKGRTATGNLDAALNLFDQLWKAPAGLSKVYLAPQGSSWAVTVQ